MISYADSSFSIHFEEQFFRDGVLKHSQERIKFQNKDKTIETKQRLKKKQSVCPPTSVTKNEKEDRVADENNMREEQLVELANILLDENNK